MDEQLTIVFPWPCTLADIAPIMQRAFAIGEVIQIRGEPYMIYLYEFCRYGDCGRLVRVHCQPWSEPACDS